MSRPGDIEYAESFVAYFEAQAANDASFGPEARVARQVIARMRATPITPSDVENIERLMVDIERADHYDGSGWHGFKSAVNAWLELRRTATTQDS